MLGFSRNKNERILEKEALCFQDTQILTSEYVVRVGSQRQTPNAKRWKEVLPQSTAWRYPGVIEREIKAGPVLAGLELMTQCFVKVEKNHLCSIHFLNTVQEESRNK